MDFNEYQRAAAKTAIYPGIANEALSYLALGLASEAGEVAGKIKKRIRDGYELTTSYELGDCLWYVAQLATELGVPLENIANHNLDKLSKRQERGTLGGSGDDR